MVTLSWLGEWEEGEVGRGSISWLGREGGEGKGEYIVLTRGEEGTLSWSGYSSPSLPPSPLLNYKQTSYAGGKNRGFVPREDDVRTLRQ